jgi:hypothetical protein
MIEYIEIPLPNNNSQIWDKITGKEGTQVLNLQENKMVVCLLNPADAELPMFNGFNKMTKPEAQILVQSDKYIDYNLAP